MPQMADDNDDDKPRIIGAKVIRGGSSANIAPVEKPMLPPPRRPGVVSGEDYEAKQSANKIVSDANARAAEIIAEANREKETVFRKAADRPEKQAAIGRHAAQRMTTAQRMTAQTSDARPNRAVPAMKTRRRPSRSAARPPSIRKPANVRV